MAFSPDIVKSIIMTHFKQHYSYLSSILLKYNDTNISLHLFQVSNDFLFHCLSGQKQHQREVMDVKGLASFLFNTDRQSALQTSGAG